MAPRPVARTHFSPDTSSFIELLYRYRVRYLIAGGEAVIFHGRVRLTGDVDFYYDRDRANAGRLYQALEEFWGGRVPGIAAADELADPGVITQFGSPPNRIDLINDIDGVTFEQAWLGRVEAVMVGGERDVPVPYLGRMELIANKQAAGRPKDLDDLAYLTAGPG